MTTRHRAILVGLLVLLAAAAVGLFLTGGSDTSTSAGRTRSSKANVRRQVVNQRPYQTAKTLSTLATTRDERRLAHQAVRLADHELDLAFAQALREAAQQAAPTSQNSEQYSRVQRTQEQVKGDQDQLAELNRLKSAPGSRGKADLDQRIALLQAQLQFDQDELLDAQQDLLRSGGNPQGRIQRLLDEHNAAEHADTTASAGAPVAVAPSTSPSLASQIALGRALLAMQQQLADARQEVTDAATALAQEHARLEAEVKKEEASGHSPSPPPVKAPASAGPQAAVAGPAAASLPLLQRLSRDQKSLADLDKRTQDEQELADVYASWMDVVKVRESACLHAILKCIFAILLIVLAIFVSDLLLERFLAATALERRRLHTLRTVLRLSVQALGVVLILLVVFGRPSQFATLLGLLGAGLTVALKDFVVAFFGWFVLMGRNGIRVGDWVEINGVGGEVVEIGLLRTILLETGNWTDAGHPTGRRVAFINSFAIEGHYFNFSTVGQWLWDELRLVIPLDANPYPLVDEIQKLVAAETTDNEQLAAQEWQRLRKHQTGQQFTPTSAINLRPTGLGTEVVVRYVARAQERYELRARLYQKVVDVLHHHRMAPTPGGSVLAPSPGNS